MIRKFFSRFRGKSSEDTAAEVAEEPKYREAAAPAPPKEPAAPPQVISHKPDVAARTVESMCGIDPKKMSRDEIRAKLAELYRRHNQAAGSLNEELRQEAELMLDAIVDCREKYVDVE